MLTPTAPTPFDATESDPATTVSQLRGPRMRCSADPYDLTGSAHMWNEFGEDHRGTIYRCEICGVMDVGP
ncbi:hypothetical protein [Nonomuraea candida]|uniref:hypothetical protein n=1 Tax=Nonomuraea candida TaxID=359159 RepID=UPI0005BB430E|nr:hypothetical protein [Nonomuraea candida]